MSDGDSLDPGQLRQAIAVLEAQQFALKLDFTAQIVELQQRLAWAEKIAQSGAGAIATTGGVSAGASGVAVGGRQLCEHGMFEFFDQTRFGKGQPTTS